MNTSLKDYLIVAIIITLAVFAYVGVSFVQSYANSIDPSSLRSFSANAQGKASATPDIATFSFSVITQGGKNLQSLQNENTQKTNAALTFVKSQGIEAKDITTQLYNIEPRYQYVTCTENSKVCPPTEIVGYTVTQNISVKVRDFTNLGNLLSGVVENGANAVSQFVFAIEDQTKLENQAREQAITAAKERAQAVAKAGGFTLGKLLSISEGSYPTPMPYNVYAERSMGMDGASAPTTEPGSHEVTVNVTLTYEIKGK